MSYGKLTLVQYWFFLFVLWRIGWICVQQISLARAKRLASLIERVEGMAASPVAFAIQYSGNDETAGLARSINKLGSALIRGNRLVADVAHEIRTPLALVRGQLESLQENRGELHREQLLPILDEVTRMGILIHDLQQLSLAKADRLHLQRRRVVFDNLVDEIFAVMQSEAEAKGVQLEIEGEVRCEVYIDLARIKQVLINLIGNAIRYTQPGGKVEVRVSKNKGSAIVQIVDNGPGIPPESLPYIFDRFYRTESSRSRKSGGMGLGLAIAKEFVAAHGGTLTVESELDEGSTFTMLFDGGNILCR